MCKCGSAGKTCKNSPHFWRTVFSLRFGGASAVPQGTTVTGSSVLSWQTASNTWRIVGTGDFNQDGHPDVVWQDPVSGTVQIWYLNGAQGNVVFNAVTPDFQTIWFSLNPFTHLCTTAKRLWRDSASCQHFLSPAVPYYECAKMKLGPAFLVCINPAFLDRLFIRWQRVRTRTSN